MLYVSSGSSLIGAYALLWLSSAWLVLCESGVYGWAAALVMLEVAIIADGDVGYLVVTFAWGI